MTLGERLFRIVMLGLLAAFIALYISEHNATLSAVFGILFGGALNRLARPHL